MKHSTYRRRSHTVSMMKKSGDDPGGLLAQERPPGCRRPPSKISG
jgi:hypothetical protein